LISNTVRHSISDGRSPSVTVGFANVDRALGHGGQHDWVQPAASSGLPSLNDATNGVGPRVFLRLVRKRCGTSQFNFLSQTRERQGRNTGNCLVLVTVLITSKTAVKTTIIGRELPRVQKNPSTEFL